MLFGQSSSTHRASRRSFNVDHPIPMPNLDQFDTLNGENESINPCKSISSDYLDHGDQNVMCGVCKALLWDLETNKGKTNNGVTSYSLCCSTGDVQLPDIKPPPMSYMNLFLGHDSTSKYFLQNIRRYNSMFSFTSLGGKIDNSINRGDAPYTFRLGGENYHSLGSLLPMPDAKPRFSQLYIYDTENEISNKRDIFRETDSTDKLLDNQIICFLKDMLDSHNPLVKSYRIARDCFQQNPNLDLKLRIIGTRKGDARTYNLPTTSEVAALIVGDIGDAVDKRDIIVATQSGSLKRISELHPSYVPFQYPIFFLYGDDGYSIDILHRDVRSSTKNKRKKCTMREFWACRFQDRPDSYPLTLNGRRLTQQLFVDSYTMIETQRLHYVRTQQKNLRSETYENLRNLHSAGTSDVSSAGQRIILPSSFTEGAHLDAMTICRWFGYPDFFITITCNPNWLEIKRFLRNKNRKSEDRPDILCRVFKMKLDSLMKDLKDKALFGKLQAGVYTIEFHKCGLPHAHICLFLHSEHKIHNPECIDNFISAEIPDKNEDPELYSLVSDHMMHGPCGVTHPQCTCMVDNECSKNFPKKLQNETSIDSNGFPVYRRRDLGNVVVKSGVNLDNRHVVPYNKKLLKKYQAHINVEWCNQEGSIKYLFKYINKGPDRATISLVQNNAANQDENVDEVKAFYDCRFLSACETAWRIFAFDVHYRFPSVTRLPFHLPGQQTVVFADDDDVEDVLNKPTVGSSRFTGWMECNQKYDLAQTLTYAEFPTKFVWKQDARVWELRKRGFSIGRIHHVPPAFNEAYFLRILLNKVKGPKCFEDIRKVDGEVCATYRDACYKRGILDDDNEYIEAIEEASHTTSGYYLRSLFATMLITYSLSRPDDVWEKSWKFLIDGILYKQQKEQKNKDLVLSEAQLKNLALLEIQNFLLRNNCSLRCFPTMPFPDDDSISASINRFMNEELAYDTHHMTGEFERLYSSLIDEQCSVFNEIMEAVDAKNGGVFFVYGYGGTGKTFLWKTLSASKRSKSKIVLSVASSGIASLLLEGVNQKHEVNCRGCNPSDFEEASQFANWLLEVGEGTLGGDNDGNSVIEIPNDLLIGDSADPLSELIDFVYPALLDNFNDISYFQERAILAPLNEVVQDINDRFLTFLPGEEVEYLSSDSIDNSETVGPGFDQALHSPDFLNGLKLSGMPNHKLVVKVGVPVMLLRNIDQKNGLCNGTRLQIIQCGRRFIEVKSLHFSVVDKGFIWCLFMQIKIILAVIDVLQIFHAAISLLGMNFETVRSKSTIIHAFPFSLEKK
ncbi:uncharacterized protein LOC143554659 [Bidens hawaiensis]|uniref:uncharacterized protein LOC143554659 n=1 Tax=Bidens hawaiensis TaxID=980011 RepID=UPI00404A02A4